ncbi:MAG: 3-dehydroquinate synthase family protein, partial [Patescibacteria group bacterium]
PVAVIMDPLVLTTLPNKIFTTSLGEVVKYGLLDGTFFAWLEKNKVNIKQRKLNTLQQLIIKCAEIKQAIVEADEHEGGARMLLNLGHTFGHAFEQLSGYRLPHGQAVAIGLVQAAQFAHMLELERLINLLQYFNLPIKLAKPYPINQVIKAMQADKKRHGNQFTLILPEAIGHTTIHNYITKQQIIKFFIN